MNQINTPDDNEKTNTYEYDCNQKMDEIIYQLKILLLNTMIDVLEKLNEKNEDQMKWQTTITYI